MNAVDILHHVEKYFDRNHNLFCKFGGLFAITFLMIFVPYSMVDHMNSKLEAQQIANELLVSELETLNHKVEFLNLSYEKKQAVMREVECLARNIYFEAGGEPRAGKIAVAEVTMNRVKSRQFPRTVCGVVHQRNRHTCQFSWVCEGKKSIRHQGAWRESVKIAENILISKHEYGIIGSAKYFHATYVDPEWAERKRVIKKIGQHIFYH